MGIDKFDKLNEEFSERFKSLLESYEFKKCFEAEENIIKFVKEEKIGEIETFELIKGSLDEVLISLIEKSTS